jgi:hypothetical protein
MTCIHVCFILFIILICILSTMIIINCNNTKSLVVTGGSSLLDMITQNTNNTCAYYMDRNKTKGWEFYTNSEGCSLLKKLSSIVDSILSGKDMLLTQKDIQVGKAIYANKTNLEKSGVTWSQSEYDTISFQREYIRLKSLQRFTESYNLYQKAYNYKIFDNINTSVKVVSLGGGPGFELLAFKWFFEKTINKTTTLDLISVDLAESWRSSSEKMGIKFVQYDLSPSSLSIDNLLSKIDSSVDYIVISYVLHHYMTNIRSIQFLIDLLINHSVKAIFINTRVKYLPALKILRELDTKKSIRTISLMKNHSKNKSDNRQMIWTLNKNYSSEYFQDKSVKIMFPNVPYS